MRELQRESNARFVKWSDGSMQLLIGNEVLDISVQDAQHDQAHLFLRHEKVTSNFIFNFLDLFLDIYHAFLFFKFSQGAICSSLCFQSTIYQGKLYRYLLLLFLSSIRTIELLGNYLFLQIIVDDFCSCTLFISISYFYCLPS